MWSSVNMDFIAACKGTISRRTLSPCCHSKNSDLRMCWAYAKQQMCCFDRLVGCPCLPLKLHCNSMVADDHSYVHCWWMRHNIDWSWDPICLEDPFPQYSLPIMSWLRWKNSPDVAISTVVFQYSSTCQGERAGPASFTSRTCVLHDHSILSPNLQWSWYVIEVLENYSIRSILI